MQRFSMYLTRFFKCVSCRGCREAGDSRGGWRAPQMFSCPGWGEKERPGDGAPSSQADASSSSSPSLSVNNPSVASLARAEVLQRDGHGRARIPCTERVACIYNIGPYTRKQQGSHRRRMQPPRHACTWRLASSLARHARAGFISCSPRVDYCRNEGGGGHRGHLPDATAPL